jgi:DNA-binding MarR family transcriptional regulator
VLRDRLGYLLKHAQLAVTERTTAVLAPLGINGRELAVLTVLREDAGPALAQQQAAGKLNVDRTTMVDLVDVLEGKGLDRSDVTAAVTDLEERGCLERTPDPADRRRNLVHLTTKGEQTRKKGERLYRETEQALLSETEMADLKRLLQKLSEPDD